MYFVHLLHIPNIPNTFACFPPLLSGFKGYEVLLYTYK